MHHKLQGRADESGGKLGGAAHRYYVLERYWVLRTALQVVRGVSRADSARSGTDGSRGIASVPAAAGCVVRGMIRQLLNEAS